MNIKTIAFLMLIGHAVSLVFITIVIRKQRALLKLPIDKELRIFRKILFALSCFILIGNVIPIAIDILTFFVNTGRPSTVKPISVAYALSNSFTAAISAALIWTLYKLAEGELPPMPWLKRKK